MKDQRVLYLVNRLLTQKLQSSIWNSGSFDQPVQCCLHTSIWQEGGQPGLLKKNLVHIDPTPVSTSTSSSQSAPQTSNEDKAAEQVHKPVAPFPNRLRNNNKNMHMEDTWDV